MDQTNEQNEELRRLLNLIADQMGEEVKTQICADSRSQMLTNDKDWYDTFSYAIKLANKKLNAPILVLDASEYEEIIKAQELMEHEQ